MSAGGSKDVLLRDRNWGGKSGDFGLLAFRRPWDGDPGEWRERGGPIVPGDIPGDEVALRRLAALSDMYLLGVLSSMGLPSLRRTVLGFTYGLARALRKPAVRFIRRGVCGLVLRPGEGEGGSVEKLWDIGKSVMRAR
jgi:hypothetical protein